MSTQVLDYAKVSPSSPADVGNCGMDAVNHSFENGGGGNDSGAEACNDAEYRDGRLLWSYTVPAGQQLTVKSISHLASHAVQCAAPPSGTGAYVDAGVVLFKKNGTTFLETKLLAPNIYGPTPGGAYQAELLDLHSAKFNIGGNNGVTFVGNTDTFTIDVTPGVDDGGIAYFVTALGKLGAVTDIKTGFGMGDGVAALTNIFTYAPTTDWKLRTVKLSAICGGSVIYTQMRMTVNGSTVALIPKVCHANRMPAANELWFPWQGIKFQQGDVIALYGHILLNARHTLITQMAGKLDPYAAITAPIVGRGSTIVRAV